MSRVPAVTVRLVVARLPEAVSTLAEALTVSVEYVLEGMLLVSVKVKAPTEPAGNPDISPVDTVTRPELDIAPILVSA